jgi:hypothetical protein
MFYTRQLPPTVIDVAYEVGDLWLDQPSGRVWRYAGPGQWEPWSTSAGKPVGAEQLFPGPDGSDIGLADAPTANGLYALSVDGGDIEWAEIEGLLPAPGDDGDVLTVVDGAWASAPAGLPGPDPTGATAGHVWTADGDDGADWAAPSGGGGSLWSADVSGGGIATDIEGDQIPLQRTGSPATFSVTIPAEELEAGAVFELYASAIRIGEFGSLQITPVAAGGISPANDVWAVFGRIHIIEGGEDGALVGEGMGFFGPSKQTYDLSAGLTFELCGASGPSSDVLGLRLHIRRVI